MWWTEWLYTETVCNVQLWPEVLRMTQILVVTTFGASVFLDLVIMMEKASIVTKLFLGGWEKLLLEDVLFHSYFMSVFSGTILSEPTPLTESNLTYSLKILYCLHDTGSMEALIFSSLDKLFSGFRIHQRKWPYLSPQQSSPFAFCLSLMVFCCPSWPQASLQKSSPYRVCRCTHTCLLHSWANSALVVLWSRSWIDIRSTCWTFFGTLKPSSQQLNISPWSTWLSYKWLI